MKLQSKRRNFLASFLILFLVPSHSAEFEINFIETFDENYMLEVIQELKYENNIKRIKTFLDQKHWIERYEIKRNFFTLISSMTLQHSRRLSSGFNQPDFLLLKEAIHRSPINIHFFSV